MGFSNGAVDAQEVANFQPDLILHNIPNIVGFPFYDKCIAINFNETDSDNSFSFTNKSSDNYIESFVCIDRKIDYDEKYSSDVAYIGNPTVFGPALAHLINSDVFTFKSFSGQPVNIPCYVGSVKFDNFPAVYNLAKVSVCLNSDNERIRDIVAFGGNPVVFNGDVEDFIQRVIEGVRGKRFTVQGYNREKILSKDTNFDRMSSILEKTGFSQTSSILQQQKNNILKDYV